MGEQKLHVYGIILIWVNNYDFIYMVKKVCKTLVRLLFGYRSIILFTLTLILVCCAGQIDDILKLLHEHGILTS